MDETKTYVLLRSGEIRCRVCGSDSYSSDDVEKHYCGRCYVCHDDTASLVQRLLASPAVMDIDDERQVTVRVPAVLWKALQSVRRFPRAIQVKGHTSQLVLTQGKP